MPSAAARDGLEARHLASPAIRSLMRRRVTELAALGLGLGAAALFLALISYHPADPSLDTATSQPPANLAGTLGATIADLLIQGFGLIAVLPVLAMLAWTFRVAIRHDLGRLRYRMLGTIAAMPVLATLFAAIPPGPSSPIAVPITAGPGGAVGRALAGWLLARLSETMGPLGVLLFWLGTASIGVLLAGLGFGLSRGEWRRVGAGVGHGLTQGFVHGFAQQGARPRATLAARVASVGNAARALRDRVTRLWPESQESLIQKQNADAELAIARMTGGVTRREPRIVPAGLPPMPEDEAPISTATSTSTSTPVVPTRSQEAGAHGLEIPAITARPRVATAKVPPPAARQGSLDLAAGEGGWRLPSLSLLKPAPPRASTGPSEDSLQANARLLESVLADYGVQGTIREIRPGPVVTLYELEPAPGIRSARVIGLADDVARSLSVTAVRIATVPNRNAIGIEVPNAKRETVYLSEILGSEVWERNPGRLVLPLGKDIAGSPVVADLARMPHLLIAGTTGSGKSVGVNAMILSLLYRLSPDQCRLILIDPKMLELSVYDGIPHLMAPVVTEPAKAVMALKWTVREMERRYRLMSQLGVRNIGGYNDRVAEAEARGEQPMRRVQTGFDPETGRPTYEEQTLPLERMPLLVVVIDEMADLMMVAGKEIELAVQRLAQMARAAGIHVVMATQRPSVDVITGTIKANFPTRISFQVISKFDSRTILGEQGAEQLLGQGDLLHMVGGGRIARVHGPFVSDREVEDVVAFLRSQGEPNYVEEVTAGLDEELAGDSLSLSGIAGASEGEKGLFDQAVALVAREGKASTSFLQRHLQIGYNRAAKLIEQMEKEGVVSSANHVGKREVLVRHAE